MQIITKRKLRIAKFKKQQRKKRKSQIKHIYMMYGFLISIPIYATIQYGYTQIKHIHEKNEQKYFVSNCRLKFITFDDNGHKQYLCNNDNSNEYILLNQYEITPKIKSNMYIGRPMKIYQKNDKTYVK